MISVLYAIVHMYLGLFYLSILLLTIPFHYPSHYLHFLDYSWLFSRVYLPDEV